MNKPRKPRKSLSEIADTARSVAKEGGTTTEAALAAAVRDLALTTAELHATVSSLPRRSWPVMTDDPVFDAAFNDIMFGLNAASIDIDKGHWIEGSHMMRFALSHLGRATELANAKAHKQAEERKVRYGG